MIVRKRERRTFEIRFDVSPSTRDNATYVASTVDPL